MRDGKEVALSWLESHDDAKQSLLEKHQESHPACLCVPGKELPLYIAQKHSFYLARMPLTGDQHASFCPCGTSISGFMIRKWLGFLVGFISAITAYVVSATIMGIHGVLIATVLFVWLDNIIVSRSGGYQHWFRR